MDAIRNSDLDGSRISHTNIYAYNSDEVKVFLRNLLDEEAYEKACILRDELAARKTNNISDSSLSKRLFSLMNSSTEMVRDFITSFPASETSLGEAIPISGNFRKASGQLWPFRVLKIATRGAKTMAFVVMTPTGSNPVLSWIDTSYMTNQRLFPDVDFAHFNIPKEWDVDFEYLSWNWDLYLDEMTFKSRTDIDETSILDNQLKDLLQNAD